MSTAAILLTTVIALLLTACATGGAEPTSAPPTAQPPPTPAANQDLDVVTVLEKDAIPAIRSSEFVNVAAAESWMNPDEPIIGVEIDGDARAYPTAMLSRHEIVNDTVGGAPVAVTW